MMLNGVEHEKGFITLGPVFGISRADYTCFMHQKKMHEIRLRKGLLGKPSETDSIKSNISSKTSRGIKYSTKNHHHRHHQRQPDEQQFPIQVVTG